MPWGGLHVGENSPPPGAMLKDLQPVMPRDALAGTAACTFEVGGRPMKVKTFTGSETAKVDKRVNDWLAQFGIKPHHTNTAIGQFTVKAEISSRASR